MKLFIFFFALFTARVLECESFDFGRLFGISNSPKSRDSSSDPDTLSNKLEEDEQKQLENGSFSWPENFKQELNDSESLFSEIFEKDYLHNSTRDENLLMDNSTEHVKSSIFETEVYQSSTNKEESYFTASTISSTASNYSMNATVGNTTNIFSSTEDPEEVVLGTRPSTFTVVTKTIYEKTIEWVGDTYTLSILIPVAAGVLFAVTIILTIATCRCIKRKCRRRRFRKRVLPDSIKSLRPSDQARLLGDCCDSSDEF